MAALLMVSGCRAPSQTSSTLPAQPQPTSAIQPPSVTEPRSGQPATAPTASGSASPEVTTTLTKRPTAATIGTPDTDPVTLVREQGGFRIEAAAGQLSPVEWLDGSRLLIFWSITDPLPPNATYLADLTTGKLRRIAINSGHPWLATQPEGQFAVVYWNEQAAVIDLQSGAMQTVFARDPAVPQWATSADHRWDFGDLPSSFSATWIGRTTVVLTLAPYAPERNLRDWGKVMLVDIAAQHVRVLAEQGHLAAVFPDGSLLTRHGWIDGKLQLFTPNTTQPPLSVAPKGFWTSSWVISPDGQNVAWLEWDSPAGDWTERIPHDCCSGEPHPTIRGIAIWDRQAKHLRRFPADGIRWLGQFLIWRQSSEALLFSRVTNDPVSIDMVQMTLDGAQTSLASHPSYDVLGGTYERVDGSLYYAIGQLGANTGQVIRRYPNGRLEVICDGFCNIDDRGIIHNWEDGQVVLQDVTTGATYRGEAAARIQGPSLEIPWTVAGDYGPTLRISRK
jgi:hypothetical protein